MSAQYDALADLYRSAKAYRIECQRDLTISVPRSAYSRALYVELLSAQIREDELRDKVLNHPDSPPQG